MDKYLNVIFDLYGTLIDIHTNESRRFFWKEFAEFLKGYGVIYHPAELQKLYRRACRQETERLRKQSGFAMVEISIDNVFRQLCRNRGYEPDELDIEMIAKVFRTLSTDYLKLYPEVMEILTELKNQGKKIYLLSNAQQLFTDYEMDILDLRSHFDGIFYSSACGCRKPDTRFYDCLFEKHGLNKKESIMIGNDYYDDILSAHSYGLASVYVHTRQSRPFRGELPDDCTRGQKLSDILKLQ
ncbi:MAG: HAD family hydrolase [Erysipelotrichaceae bacterium]|nr:HAD family hydrolase [Erysipelotrichaceae bacterium]